MTRRRHILSRTVVLRSSACVVSFAIFVGADLDRAYRAVSRAGAWLEIDVETRPPRDDVIDALRRIP